MPFNPEKEEDFLLNEYFIQWAMHPNEESDRFWKHWVEKNPDKTILLKRAKEILRSFKPVEYQMDEAVSEQLLNNILLRNQSGDTKETSRKRSRSIRAFSAAAVLFFIIGLTAGLMYLLTPATEPIVAPKQEWVSKSTEKGAKLTFKLPDGSLVRLNASSSITFPTTFTDSLREVRLEGQAFFEVEKNPSAPFVVTTDELQINVLGTSFDLKAYPNESVQTVALVSGEVSISSGDGLHEVLYPLEMISYSKDKKEMVKEIFDPEQVVGWKEGIIRFKNTDFPEVFGTLERWYGVDITIRPSQTFTGRFTGRFDNESLKNVLTGMSFSEGFHFRIQGDQVEIY